MGADRFVNVGHGRNVDEAFHQTVDQAQWEHGHGGYTGTIAGKHGVVVVDLPARWTARRFQEASRELLYADQDVRNARSTLEYHPSAPARRDVARAERKLAQVERKLGAHVRVVRQAAEVADDKWGPAVAVEVSTAEKREYVARHRLKRGQRVYLFFGTASS